MELIAKEGYWLTEANLENEAERNFWRRLSPAYSLTAEDFTEWSDEQKAQWEAEHPIEPSGEISDTEALEIITGK